MAHRHPPAWHTSNALSAAYPFSHGIYTTYANEAINSENNAEELIQVLTKHDENKINNCNSDIDTLLVFAGLFSAIIAAFTIESYKTLQEDPNDRSAALLAQISQQLANSSSSQSLPTVSSFEASESAIRINVLWFVALICSLTAASLGIFVKQWLREYLQFGCTAPEERIRIRNARYEGLLRWKVFETAAILPFLLQVSLFLFFLGLSEFLRALNRIVWILTTVFIVIWLSSYVMILCIPAISSRCPYKTALLVPTHNLIRRFLNQLWYGKDWRYKKGYLPTYYRYPGDERAIRRDPALDANALIKADKILQDDAVLLNILGQSIVRTRPIDMIFICRKILSHRLDRDVRSLRDTLDYSLIHGRALRAVINTLARALTEVKWPVHKADEDWMDEAIIGLCAIFHNVISRGRVVGISEGIKAMLVVLSRKYDERYGEMFVWVILREPPEVTAFWDIGGMESEQIITCIPLKVSIGIMKTVIWILDNLGRPDSGGALYTSGFPRDYGLILPGPLECLLLVLSIVSQIPDHDIPSCTPTFSIFMQSFIAYTDNIQSATYGPPQSQQSKTLVTRITELRNGLGSNNFFAPEHLEYLNDKFGIILPSEEDPPPDISAEAPSMDDKSDRLKRHRRMSQAAVSFPRLPINHSLPSLRPSSMNSSSTAPPISMPARPDTHTVPPNSTIALPPTISTDGNVEIREVEHLPASSRTATGAGDDDDELEQPRLSTKFRDESSTL